ncbi:hypothetical protein SFUMM280S_07262 [Streptomyces fumanus]
MQVLPKVGFSTPITSTVLPQMFTGTCTGTWTTFPDATPGEWAAAPWAPESATASPAPARTRPPRAAAALHLLGRAIAAHLASADPAGRLDLDPGTRWAGLEVLDTTGGSAFHSTGTVTFRASYRGGALHERSRFERVDGAWVYVDGEFLA